MYTKWTSHCKTEQEKAQFEADVRRARPVLERLKDILEYDKDASIKNDMDFGSPSWPYLQAFTIGARTTYNSVIKLIDLDKQKDVTNE